MSFAGALRGKNNPQESSPSLITNQPNNEISDLMEESNRLFGFPINSLIAKYRSFWPKYKLLNENQKPSAYLGFIASLTTPLSP